MEGAALVNGNTRGTIVGTPYGLDDHCPVPDSQFINYLHADFNKGAVHAARAEFIV